MQRLNEPASPGARGTFVGVVPSAGASLRMGQSKALLEVQGETFLRRTVRALSDGGCEPVFVVVAEGDDHVAAEGTSAGAIVLTNPDPGEGPITSLRIALSQLDDGVAGAVYLPVDHPMVRPETVAALIEAARTAGARLTVPMRGSERGHPALFGAALFRELADPGLEGGARTVVHRHLSEAVKLQVDDPGVLTDIDTPEVYESVLEQARTGQTAP